MTATRKTTTGSKRPAADRRPLPGAAATAAHAAGEIDRVPLPQPIGIVDDLLLDIAVSLRKLCGDYQEPAEELDTLRENTERRKAERDKAERHAAAASERERKAAEKAAAEAEREAVKLREAEGAEQDRLDAARAKGEATRSRKRTAKRSSKRAPRKG